jgi:glyoxylase-like metal-dependent hydrolase (beta-lactamase superfamily II)
MAEAITIGDVLITPLLDGVLTLDATEAALGVPVQTVADADPDLVDGAGLIHLPVICHLIRSRGEIILVDSGLGQRQRHDWPRGSLGARLREMGVDPGDVGIVLNTHMHGDHVGWNTVDEGLDPARPFFPNARYLFQRTEWEYWIDSDRLAADGNAHLQDCVASLPGRVAVELVDGEASVTREITLVATPGHTPGHVAIGVASRGERALIVGDATHFLGQLDHPDWSPAWDADPLMAARTRSRIFGSLEGDPAASIVTSHWPYPGAGRIIRVDGKRVFRSHPGRLPDAGLA